MSYPSSPIATSLPINLQCPEVIQEKIPFDSDTDGSETEEELIELGENQLPDADKHGGDTIKRLRLQPGKTTHDTVTSTAEGSDSSEDDTNLNLVRSTVSNKRKCASQMVKSEAGTSSDESDVPSSVSVQRTPAKSRDATSSRSTVTATSIVAVKAETAAAFTNHEYAPTFRPGAAPRFQEESHPGLGLGASVKNEEDLRIAEKRLKIQAHGSRDRTASLTSHYACADCDRTFCAPDQLIAHFKRTHKGDYARWYTCSTCNRSFATSEPFKAHLVESGTHMRVGHVEDGGHSGKGKVRKSEGSLGLILPTSNDSESARRRKSYCSTCDHVYKSIDTLIKHRGRYHKSSPYKCTTCSVNFPAGRNLKYHLLEHDDHMQIVLEEVAAAVIVASRSISAPPEEPQKKPRIGAANAPIELSSDSEVEEPDLKSRKTVVLGGKAKIRQSKRRLPSDGSAPASSSKKAKMSRR